MNYRAFVVFVISISSAVGVFGELQYCRHELPNLYTFDEYDTCFQRADATELASTYCLVYAEVKPDNSSQLWQKIKTHSELNKFNYRHDLLYFGLCLNRCIEFADSSFTEDDVARNGITQHFTKVYKRPLDVEMREKYSGMIHNCLNDEFEKKYGLKLRTFIRYCDGRNDKETQQELAEADPVEHFLTIYVKLSLLLVILSTMYDYSLKLQECEEKQTNDFYKHNLEQPVPRLFTSFSLFRNYYRLLEPYRSSTGTDLSFLDGYRSVVTLGVICFHVIYTNGLHIKNPEFMEYFGNTSTGSILLNTPIGIEIFMVISGLIVYIKFTQSRCVTPQTGVGKCIKMTLLLIVQRFLRFLPSVGLLLLVNATIVSRLGDGPFWRYLTEQFYVFSRENWWKNIFMINNFYQRDTTGPHTWYIAADFQLYIFYIIVLIVMAKYPQYKKRILKWLAVITVAIPTLISYCLKLESSFAPKNESFRHGMPFECDEYNYLYTPFYNNLGGYLLGICCGDLYLNHLRIRDVGKKLKKFQFIALASAVCIAMAILWSGSIMMHKNPSIWTAIFSGVHRNLWIVVVCGIPTILMMCKLGGIAYEFCNLPLFRVLARLSFQIYIWHLLILQVNSVHTHQPFHMNAIYYLSLCLTTISASIIVAGFTTLFVDYPFAQLLESLQAKGKGTTVDGNATKSLYSFECIRNYINYLQKLQTLKGFSVDVYNF